jgi:hypothetical protein
MCGVESEGLYRWKGAKGGGGIRDEGDIKGGARKYCGETMPADWENPESEVAGEEMLDVISGRAFGRRLVTLRRDGGVVLFSDSERSESW